MDISSIYANAGYTNNVNKNSSTQKTTNEVAIYKMMIVSFLTMVENEN